MELNFAIFYYLDNIALNNALNQIDNCCVVFFLFSGIMLHISYTLLYI